MIDNSVIMLEDNIRYQVIDKIESNNNFYIYLANINDSDDIVIRKEIIKDEDKHYLEKLDNDDELELALNLFLEKNKEEK